LLKVTTLELLVLNEKCSKLVFSEFILCEVRDVSTPDRREDIITMPYRNDSISR
jgi:hypothetical protein